MTEILQALIGKIGAGNLLLATGFLGAVILHCSQKLLGWYFSKNLLAGLTSIDDIQDPKRKELVKAIAYDCVRLAEYELPDKGQGEERFKIVSRRLCMILPFLKGHEAFVATLIESSVAVMDEELKAAIPQ